MIKTELILKVGQVLLTALIAIVPPFYPRKSIYTRRANEGIERLYENGEKRDEMVIGWLEKDHTGFKSLKKAIQYNNLISGEVERIGMVHVATRGELNDFLDAHYGATLDPVAALFIEYEDGDRQPVICHPFDSRRTRRLTELHQWIRATATQRSNYLTAAMVLIWTATSILLTV